MRYALLFVLLFCCLTGCVIEQKQPMGANSDRTQGFSGYGTEHAKGWEGPLMDLMVPDASPKGLTDISQEVLHDKNYLINQTNLEAHGTNRKTSQILNQRTGISREKQAQSDEPFLKSEHRLHINQNQPLTLQIEQKVRALEKVHNAHVISDGEIIVIGIESSERDRKKLFRSVTREIENFVDMERVRMTTDRPIINRMKALEHHIEIGNGTFGGTIAEIIDTFEKDN